LRRCWCSYQAIAAAAVQRSTGSTTSSGDNDALRGAVSELEAYLCDEATRVAKPSKT
jgi:hypothetical protein